MARLQKTPKGESRTKKSFAKQCDINTIMKNAARTGTISHLAKYQPVYGDFSDFDYEQAVTRVAEANSMFAELPAEVRNEFGNNPARFLSFIADPANVDRLHEVLPALAEPGRQLPNVNGEPRRGVSPPQAENENPVVTPETNNAPPGASGDS